MACRWRCVSSSSEAVALVTAATAAATAAAQQTSEAEARLAALEAKDKHETEALKAKDKVAGRLWKLLSPLPDTTEADKPTVAAFLSDPEGVIAPFEGHPSRKRRRMERQIDRGDAESDSSDSE